VYRDDYQYGHTLKTGVYVIDERDREDIEWFKQRMEVYKGSKEGECVEFNAVNQEHSN